MMFIDYEAPGFGMVPHLHTIAYLFYNSCINFCESHIFFAIIAKIIRNISMITHQFFKIAKTICENYKKYFTKIQENLQKS